MAIRTYTLKGAPPRPPLRIDYAAQLNDEQLAAVEAGDGPVLVLAGAGSGKTRTLTFRVARLLERGVPPEGVLLLTFTNRAAREMTRRVEELAGGWAEVRRVLGGTFHHAAHALLREHAGRVGFTPGFGVLDREDARELMAACLADASPRGPAARRLPRPEVLVDLVSTAINVQRPISELLLEKKPQFVPVAEEVLGAAVRFQQRKARMNLMDFDDLLLHLKRLLVEHPDVRERLGERFRAILVDEYQDTNRLQGDIVDLLAGTRKNLTVVGDDCQSIYSFRGADFTNIMEFPARYPGCAVFQLTRNYRSTPEVLGLANASIALNRRQYPKVLRAERGSGARPWLVAARDAEEQAFFVAQRVLELREEGVPLEEMAVLYRAHAHSLELQVELARRGVPFVVRSGVRFFEQAHIKDVLAHLRFAHNPGDELAFKRMVKLTPGVGAATAEAVWEVMRALPETLAPAERLRHPEARTKVPRKGQAGFERLATLVERLAAAGPDAAPGALIDEVLRGGYEEHVRAAFTTDERRLEDLKQLAEYASRYEALGPFLAELALVSEFGAEDGQGGGAPDEYLTLSSVHQAKGLEWRAVFVLWLADGRFPLAAATRSEVEEEEERRLFYVAATRARDELVLSYPLTATPRDGERVILRPSRFLEELPAGEQAPFDRLVLEPEEPPPGGAPPALGP